MLFCYCSDVIDGFTYPTQAATARWLAYFVGFCRMVGLLTIAALVSFTTAALATKPSRSLPIPTPIVRVAITTSMGVITLDLEAEKAPITVANFLRYVDQKRFDGTVFYRALPFFGGGLIQGGTQNDPKRILKPIAHEPTSLTGLHHDAGAISMARFAPGTATGDFSILVSEMRGLDADPTNKDDPLGYAVFGKVVEGLDVARKIHGSPVSPTKGVGFLKGQMLAAPVRIISVRRIKLPPPAMILPPAVQPAPVK
jgi:peptidyl-prolyl cis-trans isomerase A (cyclophilin A)